MPRLTSRMLFGGGCYVMLLGIPVDAQQQLVDPDFKAVVERPAYPRNGPTVAIDEAHSNFHTARGQYKPFADLLTSDGYRVVASTRKFETGTLAGFDVLVIANANAGNLTSSAFTENECDVVRDWVLAGGALLLIADHAPFGSSAANLGRRFGVTMGKRWAFDRDTSGGGGITTQLVFSRENGLLGVHPLLRGRDSSEEVKHVRSFTGQSLSVPDGATALLRLSPTTREALTPEALNAADAAARSPEASTGTTDAHSRSVSGRAQGVVMTFGRGKVVVLGEAGMFSAQVIRLTDGQPRELKFGMNVAGTDDRQFALNVLHWLSGLLQ